MRHARHIFAKILLALLLLPAGLALALPPLQALQITANTPVSFSEKQHLLVLEDIKGTLRVEDVLSRNDSFRDVGDLPPITYYRYYWIVQKLHNIQDSDYLLRIDPTGWESIQSYAVDDKGIIHPLKVTGYLHR